MKLQKNIRCRSNPKSLSHQEHAHMGGKVYIMHLTKEEIEQKQKDILNKLDSIKEELDDMITDVSGQSDELEEHEKNETLTDYQNDQLTWINAKAKEVKLVFIHVALAIQYLR